MTQKRQVTKDNGLEQDLVPGLAGVPIARSAISYIDGEQGILEYRGIPVL